MGGERLLPGENCESKILALIGDILHVQSPRHTRMAKINDLVNQVNDPSLRRELEKAVAELKKRTRFGLVYESHLPEMTALPGYPVSEGGLAMRRSRLSSAHRLRVECIVDGMATVVPEKAGKATIAETVPVSELIAVQRFNDPIYPGLELLGSVERGGDRPHHAVINAENYHAAQLLLHLYEGQVDCIYLDPPYNTGAKDWTYNNDYVDSNDSFRHSKWLSFMEKRLFLAKKLLRSDGVLIITIDEHEVHHLGMLLEQIFPEAHRQMVSIVINPKGVTQDHFSRVEEQAFFVFLPGSTVSGRGDDLLTPGIEEEEEEDEDEPQVKRPRWKGLLRSGTNALRKDRKNMFYPVLIDKERGAAVGVGETLPFELDPDLDEMIGGYSAAWPIRSDKTLGNWGVGRVTLDKWIKKGYVSVGNYDTKRKTWAISYLSQEPQEQIEAGVLTILSFDETKNVVDVAYSEATSRRLKTVWHRTRHDAGTGGSDILRSIFGERRFAFPKSVYAVKDCLAAVTRNKPGALIVDLFAGSGTTLHAACLLNADDGGQRRCILVTNNEVPDDEARALSIKGCYKGCAEFEARGIFQRVTRPRCEAVITGKRLDGTPVPGDYIGGRPLANGFEENVSFFRLNYLDPDQVDIGQKYNAIAPLLWLEAGAAGPWELVAEAARREPGYSMPPGGRYAVLFREARLQTFLAALAARPDVTHVALVTNREDAYAQMRAALPAHVQKTRRLYRDYLRSFRIGTASGREWD